MPKLTITEVSKDTIKETEVPLIDVLMEHVNERREKVLRFERRFYTGCIAAVILLSILLYYYVLGGK